MAPDIVPNAKPKRLSFTREKTGWGKAAFKLRFIPFLGGGPKERDEDIFTAQELASNGAASNGVAIPTLQPTSSMKNDLGIVPKVKGKRFAGVEGGGTTWVCAISEGIPENETCPLQPLAFRLIIRFSLSGRRDSRVQQVG